MLLFHQISSNFALKMRCICYTNNKTALLLSTLFPITFLLVFYVTNSKFKENIIPLKLYFEESQTTSLSSLDKIV